MTKKYTRTRNVITPAILKDIRAFYNRNIARFEDLSVRRAAQLLKVELGLPFTPTKEQMGRLKTRQGLISIYSAQATRRETQKRKTVRELFPAKKKQELEMLSGPESASATIRFDAGATPAPEGIFLSITNDQEQFDRLIGRTDRLLSELLIAVKQPLDEPNVKTLVHHAEDMIGAGLAILSKLGYQYVQGSNPPKAERMDLASSLTKMLKKE